MLSKSPVDSSVFPVNAHLKRDLYAKIFKQEFIRELHYLWDVANDRGVKARDALTKKLINLLQDGASHVPLIGDGISYLFDAAGYVVDKNRDDAIAKTANIVDELDSHQLEVLAQVVAWEAMWRYESFIVDSLSDVPTEGVIPFAKVGVRRVLERLVRSKDNEKRIKFSESQLLAGLIEGRSGSFVQGWSNHSLTLKKQKKGMFKTSAATVDAEDVYARPAFRYVDVRHKQLDDRLYVRKKALHHEATRYKKLQQIYHGDTDSLFDFGFTRFRKSQPDDPKTGYVLMPMNIIEGRYAYEPQDRSKLSESLRKELAASTISRLLIDHETFKAYLTWNTLHPESSILDYVRTELKISGIQLVVCCGDFSQLSLAKRNLSHMDVSGSIFSGDLTETQFVQSILIGARFIDVTSAVRANFYNAFAAGLSAEEVNFYSANFSKANVFYAKFNRSNLTDIQHYGTEWAHTELKDISSSDSFKEKHEDQIKALDKQLKQQQVAIQQLNKEMNDQQEELQFLKEEYAKLTTNADELKKDDQTLKQVSFLIQREESHRLFEEYCRNELKTLTNSLEQTTKQEEMHKLQENLHAVQSMLHQHQEVLKEIKHEDFSSKISELDEKTKELIADLDKKFNKLLNASRKNTKKHLESLKEEINEVEAKLIKRIEKLEDQVTDLEEWAKEAKTEMKRLAKTHHASSEANEKIQEIEEKVGQLITEQKKQETLAEQITMLKAQLNQNAQPEYNQLKRRLDEQQVALEKLIQNPLSNNIQEQIESLYKLFDEKPSQNSTLKDALNNINLNFIFQVNQEQKKLKDLIDAKLLIKADEVSREEKLIEVQGAKIYSGKWQGRSVLIKTTSEACRQKESAAILREIQVMSRLRHPCILQFYGAYLEDDRPFLVMEKAERGALDKLLEGKFLPRAHHKKIILSIAEGLQYLHSQNILHRSIQTCNVVITLDGSAKLTGFSQSKIRTTSILSADHMMMNNNDLSWCAPEFLQDFHQYRRPADVYSFGVMMCEIVSGAKPSIGKDHQVILPENVPALYRDIILACLSLDPLERPTMRIVIDKIKHFPSNAIQEQQSYDAESKDFYQSAIQSEEAKDDGTAFQGYLSAYSLGNVRAGSKVADYIMTGKSGSEKDKSRAFDLYLQSAQTGHVRAMFNVGLMYEQGKGIEKDLSKASFWYQKAHDGGNDKDKTVAKNHLSHLSEKQNRIH